MMSRICLSLMVVCHETGHAVYEQGLPERWLSQPVGHALGMAIHESQSLFVEMQLCRSKAFISYMMPQLKSFFPEQRLLNENDLYALFTAVKPGLIRVDADEATYPLHVILRYNIEKKLFNEELTISELPECWDHYMQQYLGLSTRGMMVIVFCRMFIGLWSVWLFSIVHVGSNVCCTNVSIHVGRYS